MLTIKVFANTRRLGGKEGLLLKGVGPWPGLSR
jgi:hypothetical protein